MSGTVKCPGCNAPLAASGEVDVDGETFGVYQCDRCTRLVRFDDERFEAALTFALDRDGRLLDPVSLEAFDRGDVRCP